jgi:hypothetical protein
MVRMANGRHASAETAAGEVADRPPRRDHLWVLVIIAACALLEVWASWVTIGSVSGFPRIGGKHGLPTDWILAVTTEAYWGYALYAWLAAAPGPRSRRFAMWSAAAVFALSLAGQGASHLMAPGKVPPDAVVVLVTAQPVLVLALIAVLVHLRQIDREEAERAGRRAEAERERIAADAAEADERTALRAEADAARSARDEAEADLETARAELSRAVAKAETLTRKLDAATGRKRGGATGRKRGTVTARKQDPVTGPATAREDVADDAPADFDSEAKVLWYLDKGYSASRAGVLAGLTDSRGRQLARLRNGAKQEPAGDDRSDGDMATGEQPRVTEHTEGQSS